MCLYVCLSAPCDQSQNESGLKFGKHAPLDYISKDVFKKVTLRALTPKICHVTWSATYLLSIAMFFCFGLEIGLKPS